MRSLLRDFADRGGTVLLSSHLLHEVEAVADQLVIIGGGRIVAAGLARRAAARAPARWSARADLRRARAGAGRRGPRRPPRGGRLRRRRRAARGRRGRAGRRRRAHPARPVRGRRARTTLLRPHGGAPHDRARRMPRPVRFAGSRPSSCARWSTPAPASGCRRPCSGSPSRSSILFAIFADTGRQPRSSSPRSRSRRPSILLPIVGILLVSSEWSQRTGACRPSRWCRGAPGVFWAKLAAGRGARRRRVRGGARRRRDRAPRSAAARWRCPPGCTCRSWSTRWSRWPPGSASAPRC